jgi:thioredoxin reductase
VNSNCRYRFLNCQMTVLSFAVTAIERVAGGFSIRTIRGEIRARDVLIATGAAPR